MEHAQRQPVDRTELPEALFGLHEKTDLNTHSAVVKDLVRNEPDFASLLKDRRNKMRFEAVANLPGYFFPEATQEQLITAEHFITWLFFVDDFIDTESKKAETKRPEVVESFTLELTNIFNRETSSSPQFPSINEKFDSQLTSILRYTRLVESVVSKTLAGERLSDFKDKVKKYLDGCVRALANAAQETLPDLTTFEDNRIDEGASLPCIALLDIMGGPTAEPTAEEKAAIVQMAKACALVMSHVNDVVSWARDVDEDPRNINSVIRLFMEREQQSGRQTSVYDAHFITAQRIFTLLQEMERAKNKLKGIGLKEKWYDGMMTMIRGNATWSMESARYKNINHYIKRLRPNNDQETL